MNITVRMAMGLAIALICINMFYLEDQIGKDGVFWSYSILGVILGVISVFASAKDSPNERSYITLAVLFVLIAILNYEGDDEEEEEEFEIEEPRKTRRRKKKKKRKKRDNE